MSEDSLEPGPIQALAKSIELSWLRDQFAMAALTGLLAESPCGPEDTATEAYAFADAMLKARGK